MQGVITRGLLSDIQPDVTHTSSGARRGGALVADRVQCYAQAEDTGTGTGRWKVSVSNVTCWFLFLLFTYIPFLNLPSFLFANLEHPLINVEIFICHHSRIVDV